MSTKKSSSNLVRDSSISNSRNSCQSDDYELHGLNRETTKNDDSGSERSSITRTFSRLKRRISTEKFDLRRSESLYSLRKSLLPQLETVVRWTDLSVEVNVQGENKKILDNVCGELNNLEIVSILGPSGAGKSTLLNSIVGKIKNYTGNVDFYAKDKKITFAFVPQDDYLADQLSVLENLLFASRLKNPSHINHHEEVEVALTAFNLWNSRNHLASKCSGGERKRLSIASEMINKPKILILDEPTSGLDSSTSYIVIEYLKTINKNTTIIATIHQPNSQLFQLFDRCYILTDGKCIYNGKPDEIVEHLERNFSINCPDFTNPADFILDIANNVKTVNGLDLIDRMANYEYTKNQRLSSTSTSFIDPISNKMVILKKVERSSFNEDTHFFREYVQLLKRLLISILRDPIQFVFRVMMNFIFPLTLALVMNRPFGVETGCTFLELNETHVVAENQYVRFDRQSVGYQNGMVTYTNVMLLVFMSMVPATLILSQNINLLRKEHLNSYYALKSFYFAIITANAFFCFIYAIINSVSLFYFSEAPLDLDRIILFLIAVFLLGNIGDSLGFLLSICFPEERNKIAALTLSVFGSMILHVFSGFTISINLMRGVMKVFCKLFFCHHATAIAIKLIYRNRCTRLDSHFFELNSVIDFVRHYNRRKNHSLVPIDDMNSKVRNALKQYHWNKTNMFEFIEATNDFETNGLTIGDLDSFYNSTESYIKEIYNFDDFLLIPHYQNMVITLLSLLIICYLFLIYRLRK